MRLYRILGASIALSLGTAGLALADSIVSTTGSLGDVTVERGGETYSLSAGESLASGDQVITNASGTAEITFNGCTRTLPANASVILGSDFCDVVFADLSPSTPLGNGIPQQAIVAGGVAVAATVLIAASDDDDDDTPSSP